MSGFGIGDIADVAECLNKKFLVSKLEQARTQTGGEVAVD